MNRSLPNTGYTNAIPRALLYSIAAGALFVAIQFFFVLNESRARLSDRMLQLVDVVELAATRSILILDSDLASQITTGLLKEEFVIEARILDDHRQVIAGGSRIADPPSTILETIVGFFVEGQETVIKNLSLPETMSEAPGQIHIVCDRAKGIVAEMDHVWIVLLAAFLVAATPTFLLVIVLAIRSDHRSQLEQT